jgi:hypothetical protein
VYIRYATLLTTGGWSDFSGLGQVMNILIAKGLLQNKYFLQFSHDLLQLGFNVVENV